MKRTLPPRPSQAGFTLVELVIVIVILGALAVVVLPRLGEGSFRSAAFAEQVATAFRYGQRLAVATGCEIHVEVSSATSSYAVRRRSDGTDTSCGTAGDFSLDVPNPGGSGAFSGTATAGVTVTQGLTITFNAQGLPSPNGGTAIVGGRSIIVEADTGHVR
jgi:MSHA pilin protein MshC